MGFVNKFTFAPAPWLPLRDSEMLDRVATEDFAAYQGKKFENPNFELKIVYDVHNYFAIDLMQRIRMSDIEDKKLVVILPTPENTTYISLADVLNKYSISCRNVEVFFLNEYANERGEVAPWQSPYSRAGHFMRYFYQKLDAKLRMPMEKIHFFTTENAEQYSDMIAEAGGADVAYTSLSWSGGIGAIDAETFPAETMDAFKAMGSRIVTPMAETIAHDSLRGMFGCSGDIGNVPPCAATVGPKDLVAAKEIVDVEFLSACGGFPSQQKLPIRIALLGPVCPKNPGSLLRLLPGTCYVSESVASAPAYSPDEPWLDETIAAIREKESVEGK